MAPKRSKELPARVKYPDLPRPDPRDPPRPDPPTLAESSQSTAPRRSARLKQAEPAKESDSDSNSTDSEDAIVLIPDLFESFLSLPPKVNQHYWKVHDSEEPIDFVLDALDKSTDDDKEFMRNRDYAFLAAIAFPHADLQRLLTVTKWLILAAGFDERYDGDVGMEYPPATEWAQEVLAIMDVVCVPDRKDSTQLYSFGDYALAPLAGAFREVWDSLSAPANMTFKEGFLERFVVSCTRYLRRGQALRVLRLYDDPSEVAEDYLPGRYIHFPGVTMFPLIEYCYDLTIPEKIVRSTEMRAIEDTASELQVLAHDCVSYRHDRKISHHDNLVALFRKLLGYSEQQAYNTIQEMLRERYKQFHHQIAELDVYGEEMDKQVQTYLQGIKDITRAHLEWSFHVPRFFGDEQTRKKVRDTRQLEPVVPGYLWKKEDVGSGPAESSIRGRLQIKDPSHDQVHRDRRRSA